MNSSELWLVQHQSLLIKKKAICCIVNNLLLKLWNNSTTQPPNHRRPVSEMGVPFEVFSLYVNEKSRNPMKRLNLCYRNWILVYLMRSHKKAEPHCERCVLFTPLSVKNKFLALTPPEKCHCFTTSTIYTKGQEISEQNCDVFNLSKKFPNFCLA